MSESTIRVRPFLMGPMRWGRSIISPSDQPKYVALSAMELAVLQKLEKESVDVESYVNAHLAETQGLTFHEATHLLAKLVGAEVIQNAGHPKIKEVMSKVLSHEIRRNNMSVNESLFRNFDRTFLNRPFSSHRALGALGALLISWITVVPLIAAAIYSLWRLYQRRYIDQDIFTQLLSTPERFLLIGLLCVCVLPTLMNVIRWLAFQGTRPRWVFVSLKIAFALFPRISIGDDEASVLPLGRVLRYFIFVLCSPFAIAGLFHHLALQEPSALIVAYAFCIYGLLLGCPLWRSPLIKGIENITASFTPLALVRQFLASGLINSRVILWKKPSSRNDFLMQVICAGALVWIALAHRMALTLFTTSVPYVWPLWQYTPGDTGLLSPLVISMALSVLVVFPFYLLIKFMGVSVLTLLAILGRRDTWHKGEPPKKRLEEIVTYLRNSPLFTELNETQLFFVSEAIEAKKYNLGEVIVKQGTIGEEFFILVQGRVEIVREQKDGEPRFLGILSDGDCFGEIALIENVPRTATARALTPAEIWSLKKSDFHEIFPVHTRQADTLTHMIRRIKLIRESSALAHLSAKQISELLKRTSLVEFEKGDYLVHQGDAADVVYLVAEGTARVSRKGETSAIAHAGRGDFVGLIGIVKNTTRTADVIAETHMQCLRIEKNTFLQICLTNASSALMLNQISDHQISETLHAA